MTKITADWLTNEHTQRVCRVLTDAGARALIVGGCVRNSLLNQPVSDIDIATDALPERVMKLAGDAGIKAVPTGIDHGTVTLVSGGTPFEITTFRRDVETDGRRAVVAYSGHGRRRRSPARLHDERALCPARWDGSGPDWRATRPARKAGAVYW